MLYSITVQFHRQLPDIPRPIKNSSEVIALTASIIQLLEYDAWISWTASDLVVIGRLSPTQRAEVVTTAAYRFIWRWREGFRYLRVCPPFLFEDVQWLPNLFSSSVFPIIDDIQDVLAELQVMLRILKQEALDTPYTVFELIMLLWNIKSRLRAIHSDDK